MEFDILIEKFDGLATRLQKLSNQAFISRKDGLIWGSLGTILAVSIGLFPKWVSYLSFLGFAAEGYNIYTYYTKHRNEQVVIANELMKCIIALHEYCNSLKSQIAAFRDATPPETPKQDKKIDENKSSQDIIIQDSRTQGSSEILSKDEITMLLGTFQKLEHAAHAFEGKASKFVINELEDTLGQANLEFVDYDDSTKDYYYVEYANIEGIKYSSKAIISTIGKNHFFIYGKVFLPKAKE